MKTTAPKKGGEKKYTLVLLRHGESVWNMENLFCGWHDADLSAKGEEEAKSAGEAMKKEGLVFDLCYTSVLKRGIRTLWLSLEKMDLCHLPVINTWRLNERHYGALTGMNKADTLQKYGEEQFKTWRRSYDVPPPVIAKDNPCYKEIVEDARYADSAKKIPMTECLKDVEIRFMPFWKKEILPMIKKGKRIIIAAHGNSLRSLVKNLDGLTKEEVCELNIPTGIPLVYEFDSKMQVISKRYLGDQATVDAAINKVANQGHKK